MNDIHQKMESYNESLITLLWSNKIKIICLTLFTTIGYYYIPYLNVVEERLERKQIQGDKYMNLKELKERHDIFDVIIDARTPEEYKKGNVSNSISIDHADILGEEGENILQKNNVTRDKTILIYCKSGRRAMLAKEKMVKDYNYSNDDIYVTYADYNMIKKVIE
tara:strand:- start:23 stop:517 length:495 start_codon:yes stop_codon:yes gene_type:complete